MAKSDIEMDIKVKDHSTMLEANDQVNTMVKKSEVQVDNTVVTTTSKTRSMKPKGPVSYVTLGWLTPLMILGAKKPLETQDLPKLRESEQARTVVHMLDPFWKDFQTYSISKKSNSGDNKPIHPPSITKRIVPHFILLWLTVYFTALVSAGIAVFLPYIQAAIINKINIDDSLFFIQSGLGLALLYFLTSVFRVILESIMRQCLRDLVLRFRPLIVSTVFAKATRMGDSSAKKFGEGRILQLVNVDVESIVRMVSSLHMFLILPFQIAAIMYSLVRLLGSSLSAAAIVVGAAVVIMPIIIFFLVSNEKVYMKIGDERLKILREIFQGIKYIKLRGTEEEMKSNVHKVRGRQVKALFGVFIAISIFGVLLIGVPTFMPIATFIFYGRKENNILNPAIIFPALTFFQSLMQPLQNLPQVMMAVISGLISWKRLTEFLLMEETPLPFTPENKDDPVAVKVVDANFKWERSADDKKKKDEEKKEEGDAEKKEDGEGNDEKKGKKDKKEKKKKQPAPPVEEAEVEPLLKDLNVEIRRGELTAVVGVVGSGKSSFLSALVAQMTQTTGAVTINGSVALCQQQPWLMSLTVRENIYFGKQGDEERLNMAVKCCGLEADLKSLEKGIETEIGEKGITLSGGQKARVALARAVYDDADIYLLDDPLSALDAHVSREVYDNCICGTLSNKTRVLVTHQLYVLPKVDRIIVFDHGKIVEHGTYNDLINIEGGVLKGMMDEYSKVGEGKKSGDEKVRDIDEKTIVDSEKSVEGGTTKKEKSKIEPGATYKISLEDDNDPESKKTDEPVKKNLIEEEDREKGAVKFSVVVDYYRYGGGFGMFFLIAIGCVFYGAANGMTQIWLTWWATNRFDGLTLDQYIYGYSGFSVATFLGV
ncbi:Multidrug resistance-associated protein 1, partial [Blyttiomyces sp. JEL0837]